MSGLDIPLGVVLGSSRRCREDPAGNARRNIQAAFAFSAMMQVHADSVYAVGVRLGYP